MRRIDAQEKSPEQTLGQYYPELRGYALRLCRDWNKAQDLVQDTFMKVLVAFNRGRYQEEGQLKAWLFRIMHNCFINGYRRSQRAQFVSEEALLGNEGSIREDHPMSPQKRRSPEEIAVDRDLVELAIAELEATDHGRFVEPLLMNAGEGYEKHEVAEKLGRPAGTVMSQVFRATRQCREALEAALAA